MTGFAQRNPAVVLLYFAAVTGISMFSMDPVILTLSLLGAVSLFLIRNGTRYAASHGVMLLLFVGVALINPLVSHNGLTVLFVMNDNPVTLEALLYGIVAAVMITATMYWFRSFSHIMTSDKLLYVFSLLSPKLALVLSMALRYVPLFVRRIRQVFTAQKAIGMYRRDTVTDTVRGGLRTSAVMITWGLENGIITADSMQARGYGTGRRTAMRRYRFRVADGAWLVTIVLLTVVTLLCIHESTYTFYPLFSLSDPTTTVILGYAAYAVLALLPLLSHIKEGIRWAYFMSKV